jgi:hypothetical protein
MLREVGARAVDLETGAVPTPLRPREVDEPRTEPERRRFARPGPSGRRKSDLPRPAPVEPPLERVAPAPARPDPGLEEGVVLCLEDTDPPVAVGGGRPWARGLRG